MSRRSKGPRLWWRKERRKGRQLLQQGAWFVIDQGKHIATGCFAGEDQQAQQFLASYIEGKYSPDRVLRDIKDIDVADVLSIYDDDCGANQANRAKLDERLVRLGRWWGGKTLSDVNGVNCRAYAQHRGSDGGARRDLEDLRAAINHHAKEGYHRGIVRVVLPPKGLPRERWLTRDEAARLLWACWRYREEQTVHRGPQKGMTVLTDRRPLRHVARFVLIGLYTGTRAGAIASAAPYRAEGRAFVDLDRKIFYRKPIGKRATLKRQTPVPIPDRLLVHMRRWVRRGLVRDNFIEWNGQSVMSVKTGFASGVRLAELDLTMGNVTPHTLRHTAATWLMQRAAPMWEAAGFLGMSEKTLRDTYGHHHPDFLQNAAKAMGSRPAQPREKLVIPLVMPDEEDVVMVQPVEIIGGPGRTRTCNQTVMSGRL
ncbi:Site-specific recombinase XerD [Tardiphaga sp. OK246]|nr:Site-specific recombinase XerD [Tardiphaga sp. OK246]